MFSCEIYEIFKNTYFEEHLWATAFMIPSEVKGNYQVAVKKQNLFLY